MAHLAGRARHADSIGSILEETDRLVRSSHHTHCPFKGDASYYSFKNGAENAVWSYEQPFDEMQALKQRLAFYPDKVEIKVL